MWNPLCSPNMYHHVSYIFIIFPCILQCFELKSKKFIQTHRNRGEEGRTIQASLNFLRFLLWFAYMAEQASQTKTALQLQTVSVDFGSRSQRAMTYNFSAQAAGKEKKTSLVTWSFSCNKNLYYIPIILVTGWLKEGSYNGLVFYNGIVTIYNNLLYTSRENRQIFASSCHKNGLRVKTCNNPLHSDSPRGCETTRKAPSLHHGMAASKWFQHFQDLRSDTLKYQVTTLKRSLDQEIMMIIHPDVLKT